MAPFPEDEIMTIKRLEVALRKSDFKLLKDGAYKLHEKYHSRHYFEYIDLLEDILREVEANYAIPPDIKDILIPTIQDILANQKGTDETQNRVSSLTSLSYGINKEAMVQPEINTVSEQPEIKTYEPVEEVKQENYMQPFQEFTPIQSIEFNQNPASIQPETQEIKPIEDNNDSKFIIETYNEKPTEDLITGEPILEQQNIFDNSIQQENSELKEQYQEPAQEPVQEVIQEEAPVQEYYQEPTKEFIQPVQEAIEEPSQEAIEEQYQEQAEEVREEPLPPRSIAIFYGQDSSNEKIKNILHYRSLIHNNKEFSLYEITELINEIKTQADTNVSELTTLLEQLKTTNHKINILTNSQSANFSDLFNQTNISYSIFNPSDDKRINFLPLLGLTNLYKCFECEEEHLDTNEQINSFILQCPKCKHAMVPDLYTLRSEINMDYYNSSIISLANSDTWLLIHPSLNEKLTLNMIRSALKVSSQVKEIYILDKDINVRETCKKLFLDINPEIKVNIGLNVIEDFFLNI
ncbi:hypothetical protein IJ531_01570 [bacterium]|nr:hypothetical protein [bacterium]